MTGPQMGKPLIDCVGCGEYISPDAKACPKCGHPAKKSTNPLVLILMGVVGFVVLIFLMDLLTGKSEFSPTGSDICSQSAEAAHYIAAESATSEDVVRVTDEVVATRKYPALDDKMLGLIGSVVALNLGKKTPDEISETIRASCEAEAARHQ